MGLFFLTIHVKMINCENLSLVTPTSSDSSEISANELEKINGDLFLLTYEILSKENLQALNANYDVTLIKTNFTYPFIMHKKILEGSFFTEKEQKEEKKAAVLNKAAAYGMFGNIKVCGSMIKIGQDEYTVAGVINDETEDKSVYIPASISKENPRSFAIKLENNLTREQIKNQCKSVVSEEDGYRFVYFEDLIQLVSGLFYIGLKLTAISLLMLLIKKNYCILQQNIKDYKNLYQQYYVCELLKYYPKKIINVIFVTVALILMSILIINLIFSSIEFVLFYHDHIWFLQLNDSSAFGYLTSTLKMNIYFSLFLMGGFFINNCLWLTEALHLTGDRNNG